MKKNKLDVDNSENKKNIIIRNILISSVSLLIPIITYIVIDIIEDRDSTVNQNRGLNKDKVTNILKLSETLYSSIVRSK